MTKHDYFFEFVVKKCFNDYLSEYFRKRFYLSVDLYRDSETIFITFRSYKPCGSLLVSYSSLTRGCSICRKILPDKILDVVGYNHSSLDFRKTKSFSAVESPEIYFRNEFLSLIGLDDDYSKYCRGYFEEEKINSLIGEVVF